MSNERLSIKINSIKGGWSPYSYLAGADQFQASIGIDSDHPIDNGTSKVRGAGNSIVPMRYQKFSDTDLSGSPMWITTSSRTPTGGTYSGEDRVFVYASDGEFLTYSSQLTSASEAVIGTPTGGAGNGMAYYNNYIYLATDDDIARYGPMDGTPALTNDVWTGATLGTQTALTNPTYPTVKGQVKYPNHSMHAHNDGSLYFCDVVNGAGVIHRITTSKTTNEGDTDNGSSYNVLDLPPGFYPTDIESYGENLAISAIQTSGQSGASNTLLRQGKSAIFFWDTTSSAPYARVDIQETIVSALLNKNGELYAFAGNQWNGVTVLKYAGGFSMQQVAFLDEGYAPFPGAVDYYGDRVVWGGSATFPSSSAGTFSVGYKSSQLSPYAVNHIAKSTSTQTNPVITAVKYVQQLSSISPRVVMGWIDGSGGGTAYGLDTIGGSNTISATWRSQIYGVGKKFRVKRVIIPLSTAVAANHSITPKIYVDDASTTFTLKAINNTNYTQSERVIYYEAAELESNTSGAIKGESNLELELNFAGTAHISVMLPITIEIETLE